MKFFSQTYKIVFTFIVLQFQFAFTQELPPILQYNPQTYRGGNQNWMISQGENRFMFFANNSGLLEYNGASWSLYPTANRSILRSVKAIGNKIYAGCYMEFGYFQRNQNGALFYTSLSKKIQNQIKDDEQFWNILHLEHWVVFQSLDRLYILDTNTNQIKIISPKGGIFKSFKTNEGLYFQTLADGLFEIEGGKGKLLIPNTVLGDKKIVNLFSKNGSLSFFTQNHGIYSYQSGKCVALATDVDQILKSEVVYSAIALSDGTFALGTISNGLIVLDENFRQKYHISQSKGLSNNTILSLTEDKDKNLWMGLDNGINCLNMQSPIKSFVDNSGKMGTVYASKEHLGKLYIGTNQGLFVRDLNAKNDFFFIPNTKGQVWSLFVHDNTLFCGHDSGTFQINGNQATVIRKGMGTWKFATFVNQKNIIIQGAYDGLSVLEKRGNQWVFGHKILGFDNSARFFEISNQNDIYVSHEYKGVFRLKPSSNLSRFDEVFKYKNPPKGLNASLSKFHNHIYYAYEKGIFKLNPKTKVFEKDKILSDVFEKDKFNSGKMIADDNKIWLFTQNYIHYFSLSKMYNQLIKNTIPIPSSLTSSMVGYENVMRISNTNYLIGTTDGYYILDLEQLNFKNQKLLLTKVLVNQWGKSEQESNINEDGSFSYKENNVHIHVSVPEYNKYLNPEFCYQLEGFDAAAQWSPWSPKSNLNFKNLPPGDYTLRVKAKFANTNLDNTIEYHFTIHKPWYNTIWAWIFYIALMAVGGFYVNKAYEKYYQKQQQKLIDENNKLLEIKELENERELMRIKNEQLAADVDHKSKELAATNLTLNNKNELLTFIKEDLAKNSTNGQSSIKSVISTIDRNINEEDSWKVFKEAFDVADKDFLKRIKEKHPTLTPNDLRLCAYLRLNMSSKEIAPLFNISVRSVEIKRYRLRKKIDLPHENGLVEYILSV